jgi:MFS transporter, PAT family, beta-lactamase induction signal transducer AmpG
MSKLMMAIAGENIAVGIAGAAFVAYLSSIVAKGYSAVQYALLSSLTLLVGTLGRGALGQMIEEQGYFSVFLLTTAMGMFAVLLCVVEWVRQSRLGKDAGVVAPEAAAAE